MFCLCVWIECVDLAWVGDSLTCEKDFFHHGLFFSCVQMRCMCWPSVVVWMAVTAIGIFFLLYDWVFFLLRVAIKFVQIAGFPLSSGINQLFCQTDMCTYKLLWHHSIRLDDAHHSWELVKSTQIWHSFELVKSTQIWHSFELVKSTQIWHSFELRILTFVGDLDYLVCKYKGDVTKESLHQVSSQ